jgi:uncharacterized membrane protein YtjA (UPF0391 family)
MSWPLPEVVTTQACHRDQFQFPTLNKKELAMLYYAAVFIVMGLIGHVLYLDGMTSVAVQMSWILGLIGAVLGMVHVVTDF